MDTQKKGIWSLTTSNQLTGTNQQCQNGTAIFLCSCTPAFYSGLCEEGLFPTVFPVSRRSSTSHSPLFVFDETKADFLKFISLQEVRFMKTTNTTTVPTNSVPEIKTEKQYKKRPPRICSVEGCNRLHHAKGFCEFHYNQFCRYKPKPQGWKRKSGHTLNEVIFNEDICLIVLNSVNGIQHAIIDSEDYDKIKDYHWSVTYHRTISVLGYEQGNANKLRKYLHNVIMSPPVDMIVDHINHDNFDNRKQNLRICTVQQNNWNRKGKSKRNKTSIYKGVAYDKSHRNWSSRICCNYKRIHLGSFPTEEAAALAYNEAAIKYFGEFACLNEIKKEASND